MGLYLVYGINAAGKDAIAKEVVARYKNSLITSESRILMYHLGLVDSIDATIKVDREIYKKLENAKREDIQRIYKDEYPKTMEKAVKDHDLVMLLSHLVFALYIDKDEAKYVTDVEIPKWLVELSDGMVQLVADPEEIFSRRMKDIINEKRERIVQIKQIKQHQELCDKKWNDIGSVYQNKKMKIVENHNNKMQLAIEELTNFINNKNV